MFYGYPLGKMDHCIKVVTFLLIKIDNERCFFQFKHNYKIPMNSMELQFISEEKIKILKQLKKCIQKLK